MGNSDVVMTVDTVAAWVLAPFFAIVLRRGFFTGVTSVVSGAYFLAGPLLFGDLFGVFSIFRPDRMFLEKIKTKIRIKVFRVSLEIFMFCSIQWERSIKN